MDRGEVLRVAALGAAALGLVLALLGGRSVGRARAAARWPGPRRGVPRALGLALLAGALLMLAGALAVLAGPVVPVAGPGWRRWAFQATVGLVALSVGGYAAARLVDRAELTALIRTPHVPGQPGRGGRRVVSTLDEPGVPFDGQAGWVYRDAGGAWYLAVAAGTGADRAAVPRADPYRLVRLDDFALLPGDAVRGRLELAGSAEVRVLRPDDPFDPDDAGPFDAGPFDPDDAGPDDAGPFDPDDADPFDDGPVEDGPPDPYARGAA